MIKQPERYIGIRQTDSNSELLVSLNISHYNYREVMILWKQKILFSN